MNVEKIDLEHQPFINGKFASLKTSISDFTFANVFLFRDIYRYRLAKNGDPVIDCRMENGKACWMPLDDLRSFGKEHLIRLLAEHGVLFPVPEEWLDAFEGPEFFISFNTGEMDYLYRTEKLASFRGGKLSRKRNRLKQFLSLYRYTSKALTTEGLKDALKILEAWQSETELREAETDYRPCLEALHLFDRLGLNGMVYSVEEKPAGFLIGERLNGTTYVIHFAKGIKSYKGLYEFMFNDAAKRLSSRYEYLNLEEDLGRETLRITKSSYDPDVMVKKFRISLRQDGGETHG